jgi:5-formyltetrahydrofolate cyclo-ligase
MEPACGHERAIAPEEFDLVVAPLTAFDRAGGRLGMGGGYYDGLLKQCACPKIGLAFSFQEVGRVPGEAHDEPLDIVITEEEVFRAEKS